MFEQIKSNIRKYKNAMVMYLSENHIEFTCEAVEWYTTEHENDFYEIDIRPEDYGFFRVYYDQNGVLTHFEVEEES